MPNTPIKLKASAFFKLKPRTDKSNAELLREQNIKQRDAFLASFMNDPDFAEAVDTINSFNKESQSKKRSKIKRRHTDSTFKFTGPLETRKSLRLLDKPPIFTGEDLIDEYTFRKRTYIDAQDLGELEEVVFKPKKTRLNLRRTERPPIIVVEDVTEEMIGNIAKKVSTKEYSDSGSSCHQCRQKTKDQKTCCRNIKCIGVRGQFCGVCLENRYGEDAAKALKDPDWYCPVCRAICNCSFCRAKAGKRPTGILTPLALQRGHKSVKELLESLQGEGDYIDEGLDPNKLLGFTVDLNFAQMGGGKRHYVGCDKEENEQNLSKFDNEPSLNGFVKDCGIMCDGRKINFSCGICKYALLKSRLDGINNRY